MFKVCSNLSPNTVTVSLFSVCQTSGGKLMARVHFSLVEYKHITNGLREAGHQSLESPPLSTQYSTLLYTGNSMLWAVHREIHCLARSILCITCIFQAQAISIVYQLEFVQNIAVFFFIYINNDSSFILGNSSQMKNTDCLWRVCSFLNICLAGHIFYLRFCGKPKYAIIKINKICFPHIYIAGRWGGRPSNTKHTHKLRLVWIFF